MPSAVAPPRAPIDPLSIGAVAVAIAAVASSAPLIAFAAAPALAIAFWRNFLALVVLGPIALYRRRAELRALTTGAGRRTAGYCVLAGLALAVHFAAWMPSVQLTSVAAATALVVTQPVWQGLIALGQGRRLSMLAWLGIGLAVAGAIWAVGADFGVSGRAVAGDLLAIAGGMAAAVYTALGERVRSTISTVGYTTVCYGVCAAALLVVCLAGGVRLGGYDPGTWLAVLGLVVGAQLLGHTMFNYALRRISATTISVLFLLEAPGAALLAWAWLGQVPRAAALPGLLLLLAGVAVVLHGEARTAARRPGAGRTPLPAPPEAGTPPAGRGPGRP
ncbi:DMT family transporter [Micromonospora sp. WMMD1102]|uniref:DMT family transporter n=1 Tax=Micromonospora sp. WMMD1102 TaxID=3016105 RepID=UPI0024151E07|nr:DMT family transporter [Micromonospora sp. WMMD1102]MDG4791690.1 DMT family transporter [Micromonospora sp. WMMD1102]